MMAKQVEYEEKYFTRIGYKPYRDVGRHAEVVSVILKFKPQNVLDVGCAYGYIVKRLLWTGVEAWGCDISKWCEKQSVIGDRFACCPAWDLPYKDKQFDLLLCEGVLEHIEEERMDKVMFEFERVSERRLFQVAYDTPESAAIPGHVCNHELVWWLDKMPMNTYINAEIKSVDIERLWVYKV